MYPLYFGKFYFCFHFVSRYYFISSLIFCSFFLHSMFFSLHMLVFFSRFFFFFFLFRAELMAYGSSQARGQIRGIALAYSTATAMRDPSCICNQHHSSWQRWILTHLERPGIETASSWILVRFISTEP